MDALQNSISWSPARRKKYVTCVEWKTCVFYVAFLRRLTMRHLTFFKTITGYYCGGKFRNKLLGETNIDFGRKEWLCGF
jgi:hypothetical protein